MKALLKDCVIIDGTGNPPKEADIEITDNKISAIDKGISPKQNAYDKVIEGKGNFVLPGFINCHIHFSLNASRHPMNDMAKSDPYMLAIQGTIIANKLLKAGVTTVRDMGGKHFEVLALRNAIRAGIIQGPTVIAPGQALLMTGGHFSGFEVDGVASCLSAARAQIKAGADFIKVMATGGLGKPDEIPGAQELTFDELKACFSVAHMAGKSCAAHAHGLEGIKAIVDAGVTSVEHGTLIDESAIDVMIKKGTYLVPTFAAYWVMAEEGEKKGVPDYMIRASKWVMDEKMPRFKNAVEKRVKIAFGTDGGSPVNPHENVEMECNCLIEGGMSPMDVIMSMTINAADLLGLKDKIGSIEVGKIADLVMLGGNPLEDIKQLTNIVEVIKYGVQVN